ncbi:1-acylglycerol-3-phosphate O-acyltransferase [Planctobacterium marinum]|uniref:1-acylglycerol-3-phosphate O-acyltransferase n=1 Tax=Planctobacterium marinum TaxID=1631968 RepID=UPI001E5B747C|nr:1-acylglycerol-3-phosphate O-acyltransferase [Planctobacterium marinum]
MLAILRIIALFISFLLINGILIIFCLLRPMHRNNVYSCSMVYGIMSRILGLKVVVQGKENVPNEPVVYIANHQNSYDLITICKAVMPGTVSVGKKSLVFIPVFGWLYWLSGNVLIDRKNATRAADTLSSTVAKIKKRGISVWFFPEGTRSYGRGILPFKTGAFRIADAVNMPVVRVCASNLIDKVDLNRWDNGTLIIQISEPIYMDDSRGIKEWSVLLREKMIEDFDQVNNEVAQLTKAR